MPLGDILGHVPRIKSTTKALYDDQILKRAYERMARADAVEANDMAGGKHNFVYANFGLSRVVSLATVTDWPDPASAIPDLNPGHRCGVQTARASSQALYFATQSVADTPMVFWEQAVKNATVPQHTAAVLLSQRHDPPSDVVAVCPGRGHLTVDLHILSPR
jgi:hypothetical protein